MRASADAVAAGVVLAVSAFGLVAAGVTSPEPYLALVLPAVVFVRSLSMAGSVSVPLAQVLVVAAAALIGAGVAVMVGRSDGAVVAVLVVAAVASALALWLLQAQQWLTAPTVGRAIAAGLAVLIAVAGVMIDSTRDDERRLTQLVAFAREGGATAIATTSDRLTTEVEGLTRVRDVNDLQASGSRRLLVQHPFGEQEPLDPALLAWIGEHAPVRQAQVGDGRTVLVYDVGPLPDATVGPPPPTSLPPTTMPPTTAPPATTVPPTTVPPTTVRPTTVPPTTVLPTTVPPPTVATTVPVPTTVPLPALPAVTAPPTTLPPPTTAPPPPTSTSVAAPPTTTPPTTSPPSAGPAAPSGPAPTAPPAATPQTVVVERGESFWSIAEAQLGPGASVQEVTAYWAQLVDLNDDELPQPGNPDLILPGMVLTLP